MVYKKNIRGKNTVKVVKKEFLVLREQLLSIVGLLIERTKTRVGQSF